MEGLDEAIWDSHYDGCHELGSVVRTGSFATDDVSVLRLQHPLGTRFRVALAKWVQDGCK
ncbi:MAG: hypothetical protein E5W01_03955 [Mesorhizobium sp.]|nr:MAG: hypothetical protein E5W01_03955 [Mesorhizobium sp.]TIX06189.1 MAG: hypothetical protein E5V57_07090 [Mesorhizobium sp.]TIY10452.1 MAG: hypothetical protein E5V16_11840 [Mesorhizobium sp.]